MRLHTKYAGIIFLFAMLSASPSWAERGRIYVSTDYLYDSCMERCAQSGSLASLTRNGCLKGCAEIRRSFYLRDKSYSSMSACIKDMQKLELNRDLEIEKAQSWCNRQWTHLHKRKGCKDAMEVYINAATTNSICYRITDDRNKRTIGDPSTIGLPPAGTGLISEPLSEPLYDSYNTIRDTPAYSPVAPSLKAPARPSQPTPPAQPKKVVAPSPVPKVTPAKEAVSPTSPKEPEVEKDNGVPVLTPSTAHISPPEPENKTPEKATPPPPSDTKLSTAEEPKAEPSPTESAEVKVDLPTLPVFNPPVTQEEGKSTSKPGLLPEIPGDTRMDSSQLLAPQKRAPLPDPISAP